MSAIHTAPARQARRQGKILGAVFAVWTMASMMPVGSAADSPPAAAKAPAKTPAKAPAKGKGKAKKPTGTAAELTAMLQAKGSQVQDCAVSEALDKGANSVEIATHVTINGRGQVINIKTNVKVDKGPDGTKVRECIDDLIKKIEFPNSAAPMITIERHWTIKST